MTKLNMVLAIVLSLGFAGGSGGGASGDGRTRGSEQLTDDCWLMDWPADRERLEQELFEAQQEYERLINEGCSRASGDGSDQSTETPGFAAAADRRGKLYGKYCQRCHGADGSGRKEGTPDFTDYDWQDSHTDSQIGIGIDRMPPYNLTPEQVTDLVKYIRSFDDRYEPCDSPDPDWWKRYLELRKQFDDLQKQIDELNKQCKDK